MEGNSEESSESGSIRSCSSIGGGQIVSVLPWEILQEIFCHLDGKSLIQCKRVCISWKDHVQYLEQNKTKFWYNICQKEIPSWVQFDLLDKLYPSHWKNQNQVDWKEIYKCWNLWNFHNEAPVTIQQLGTRIRGIANIEVSGEWMLITSYEFRGKLIAQRLTGSDQVDLFVGDGIIENFQLVNTDRHPPSNVKPPAQLEEIFDTLGHNQICLELNDCYIQLGKTYCHTLDRIRQKIRHSYGYEMRLVSDHNRSSLILKKTCIAVHGPELMEIELSRSYPYIMGFWMNTITLAGVVGMDMTVDTLSVNHRTQQASLSWSCEFTIEGSVCDSYIWHGSMCIIFTNKRQIVIQKDGIKKMQVTPIRKGRMTSVLFYANRLFFGTDRGQLLIYNVKSPEECVDIEVYTTPAWTIEVCQKRIHNIMIAEPIHHKRKGPVIICATPEDIYMVSIST